MTTEQDPYSFENLTKDLHAYSFYIEDPLGHLVAGPNGAHVFWLDNINQKWYYRYMTQPFDVDEDYNLVRGYETNLTYYEDF